MECKILIGSICTGVLSGAVFYSNTLIEKLLEYQSKENTRIPVLKAELKEVEKKIANLVHAVEEGIITSSTKRRLDELEKQKSDLEVGVLQEEIEKPPITKEQMQFFFSRFKNGNPADPEFQQQLIDCFVNSVYVFDDKLVVNFNSSDSNGREISLKEVKSSFLHGGGALQKQALNRKI